MKKLIISVTMLSVLMTACGGSGSGSSNTSSVASSLSSSTVSVSSIASSEASSAQTSSQAPVATGVFLDAAVANIGYRTETQEGFTNTNGEFSYRIGELITFFIGGLELPSVVAKDIITPLDIVNTESLTDNQLINILRLLQSLDADGDASNGIEITAAAIAAGTVLDFTTAPEVFAESPAVKALLQASGSINQELISAEQAVAHFQTTLELINGPSSSSSSQSSTLIIESSSSMNSSEGAVASSSSVNSSEIVVESSSSAASSEEPIASSSAGNVAEVFFTETFEGATASNFYTTYRVNGSGQSLYKKSGGTPVFADGTITLTGARFTIGEVGKDLDLSKPYKISFDVMQAIGSGKVQIFVDNANTSGDRIFNENANTLVVGQRFVLSASDGTANSFIQIRAESTATLTIDNLVIEYTDAAGSSSSASSTGNAGASSSAAGGVSSSANSSIISSSLSSSSSSAPYIPGDMNLSADCINLATNPHVNWRDTALQTDQEIVECLYKTLGTPVGYGENAKGGYDPNGNSKLTIITKNSSTSVEQQVLDAISGEAHNWIVFDKIQFAQPTEIGMYRLGCSNATVQSILGATEAECVNYQQWCAKNSVSESACVSTFFNTAMNKSNNPIRNPVIGSNKSIDGRGSEAHFLFSGFAIGKDSTGQPTQTATSVILTHLNFKGAGHTEDHYVDPDMIRSTGASHDIWIHKNTFDTTGDSAFDVKVGAYGITMSFNEILDVKRATLHSSSDSHTIDAQIRTTMHHNLFVTRDASYMALGNTLRRVPLIRRGTSHMLNNVFVNYRKDLLSIRVGASVLQQDNMFVVNRIHQEKADLAASLAELKNNLIRDVTGGNYRGEGNFVWFGDAACNLDETTKTGFTISSGAVANLAENYSATSQGLLGNWHFAAGQDLVDYLSATAGKYGQAPFNSPLSGDRHYVLGLGKVACQ